MGDVRDEVAPDLVDPPHLVGADVVGVLASLGARRSLLGAYPGPALRLEAVAEAPGGVDVLVGGSLLQGRADPAYVDVYGARGAHAGVSPDLLRQLLPALELAGRLCERHE